MSSSPSSNDFLVAKARSAELELLNAQLRDDVHLLKQQKTELEEQLRTQTQRFASQSSSQFKEELFSAQKEVLRLTDHKASLEQQLEKANETIQQLHKNIAREVQKAKDEVERQSIFLRSQILEQKEINTSLQEKLMTALQVSKQLEDQGMHDNVTETILITSDAVLQKFRQELRNNVKGRYDVNVDINGRSMVLSGRKVNVQLLKAEIMTAMNEAYCALVDPTKYVSAAKAREEASKHEIEHLRRTVVTHELTIQSLHVALQHAQDRSNGAVSQSEEATKARAVMVAYADEERKHHESQIADLQRQIESLEQSLKDQEETSAMALNSLQAEAQVTAQYRNEVEHLREEIKRLTDVKELAERSVYVTTQQLAMTRQQLQDAIRSDMQASELGRRLEDAEHRAQTVDQRVAAARSEAKEHAERLTIELGTLKERLRRATEEVAQAKRDLQTALIERDSARAELQQSRDIIHEMRNKMVHLSVMSLDGKSGGGNSKLSADDSHHPMETILLSGERHLTRIEEENAALRTELQHAFEDMRAVATSLKETRLVRERALEDVQRLEAEKSRLFEERQQCERQLIEERMIARQRQSELELQSLALRDELQHQQKRVDMLHTEYQRKIQEQMNETARAHLGNFDEPEPMPNANRSTPSASAKRLGGRSSMDNLSLPNDPSMIPNRTPKSSVKLTAANANPNNSGVFTLRSASNEVQQSGLVSTPRMQQQQQQQQLFNTAAYRLSAVRSDGPALESPPQR